MNAVVAHIVGPGQRVVWLERCFSLVLLGGFGGDLRGQSLPDFWDDLEPATTAILAIIDPHPDSRGGWVTVPAGETPFDASYWAGDSTFIKVNL